MLGSAVFRTGTAPGGALAGPWVRNPLWTAARAVPSLDLRFADNKSLVDATTGQNLVTFTRASSGTFVGSDGVLRSAVTNLLLRSEEFNDASWGKTGSTVTANATTAPNGTLTADKIVEDNSNGTHVVSQFIPVSGTSYVYSVYAKASERTKLVFSGGGFAAQGFTATFNLSNGTLDANTGSKASIVAVGDNWYRCIVSFTASNATTFAWNLADASGSNTYLGNNTSGLFLWGAQLEQSATVGEYIPTTSTINSAPRFHHNPTTGESLGLLVEEQRVNSIRNNTMVGAVAGTPGTLPTNWANNSAAGVTFSVIGTGTENGITYVDLKAVAASAPAEISFRFEANTQATAASGQSWTASTYLKVQAGSLANITAVAQRVREFNSGGTQVQVTSQDLAVDTTLRRFETTRTLSEATTVSVNSLLAITCTAGAAIDITLRIGLPQLEQGAFATSVIPTTSATVTRAADVASITGSNFSSWYRQDEGTVFSDASVSYAIPATSFPLVASFNDGTSNNRIENGFLTAAVAGYEVTSVGSSQVGLYPAVGSSTRKLATAFQANNFAASVNGGSANTDASGTAPTVDRLRLGDRTGAATTNLFGTIRRLTYWPTRLSNEVLQRITQ